MRTVIAGSIIGSSLLGGITPDSISAFFKGTGILGGVGLLLFLMVRHKVVRLVSVDSGSEWIRAKWGVEQYYSRGKRRGRLVRLQAGRHLLVRGMYDGWEVCLREIPLKVNEIKQPFKGRMLIFDLLTISYAVIAPDTQKGDRLMLRSFLSVRNLDRDNQQSESLDDKVRAIALKGLGKHLKEAQPDGYGLPVIDENAWIKHVQRKLRLKHGVRLVDVEWTEPTWLLVDGVEHVAQALGYAPPQVSRGDSGDDEQDDTVIEMASHTASA